MKQKKTFLTRKRFIQLLEQHLHDTSLMDVHADPPLAPEEYAQARFLATSLTNDLSKLHGDRVRALVAVEMYRLNVGAVLHWVKTPPVAAAPVEEPVNNPTTDTVSADAALSAGSGI